MSLNTSLLGGEKGDKEAQDARAASSLIEIVGGFYEKTDCNFSDFRTSDR